MVDLTESLLKAISIIADKSAEEVFSDKTIKAIVKKVVNTSEGKYLVTYNNGDFYAYIQSGSTDVYEIGEQIYILVPEGDMSQKKFIIGRVKNDKEDSLSSKVLKSSLLNDYVTIGDNVVIEKEYGKLAVKKMQPLKLNSYSISDFYYCYLRDPSIVSDLPKNHYDNVSYPCVNIDEETFANSAKQAEALLIRAKFKASIDTDIIGNYGIIVNIAFADETNPQTDENGKVTYPPKLIAYVLDTSKMTGNPMKFYDYTSQYAITGFDGENYLYIDSIVAFSEGFVNQTTSVSNENDDPYIYIDDLEIVALDENSAVNGDYKLKLTTPQGNTIKVGKRDELKIAAAMTYLNQDVTENTVFYWGVKDPSITSISDEYHAKLGSGYKYLDIKNTNELRLAPGDLTAAENIYICVGVYASNIILKSTVSLYNNNNKLDITIDSDQGTIFQFNEGNPTLTCLINGKSSNYQKNYSDEAFSFIWTKEDPEFGSILLNTTETQLEEDKQREINECRNNTVSNAGRTITQVLSYYSTRITQVKNISFPNGTRGPKINCKLKNTNSYVIYSCSVYRGSAYIGYGSITLQNSKSVVNNNYYVTITNGTQVFQYDEVGIAPNSQRKQEPIEVLDLVAVFHSPQGAEVTPKKVRWIMPEGKTLINIPAIGLETDGETGRKYFVGNIFPLTIKDTYDNTCNDNQVTVIVTHNDGTEYRQTSNLLFTKIGEIGTNGTNTVVKINEPMNVPKDECLTIIKPSNGNKVFYNNGNFTKDPILEASLYTNNTQVLGYTTNWSIAGSSKSQGRNYEVKSYDDNNNFCTISYNGDVNEIDTRIIKAEINLEGKYFYSFYGIPAIEYSSGYNYGDHPIKVMRDGTLRTVLYDSNGTNPIYDKTQGVHIELPGWSETGYINWSIESGVKRKNGEYQNPNFLLAISPKSEIGSEKLIKNESELGNIKTSILAAYDTGNICKNNASSIIKDYITDFLEDVEKICVDTLLSTPNKLSALRDRLAAFNDENNVPDNQNIYIKTVYQEYYNLFEMMQTEYDACKNINAESTKLYDKIQAIWRGMWPSVITEERLNIVSGLGSLSGIDTIEKLIDKYQQLYNNRSNDSIDDFDESDIFDKKKDDDSDDTFFLTLLNRNKEYYNEHVTSLGQNVVELSPILIRYAQVLMTYLNLLVEETQSCFEGNNLHNIIKEKYSFIYSDWGSLSNSGNNHVIGQTIYDIVLDANGEFASVSESICGLYKFYRELYLGINKYQIAEESETLNTWSSILKGENPNLLNQIYVIPNKEFNGLYMNNNVVGTAYIKSGNNNNIEVAKIYIPIIMTLNTYELASLNGWDGTSVEIGDNHILTPQIGAGIKDDVTNTFTGMVMGVIDNSSVSNNSNNDNNFKLKKANKIGLIGYSNGKQSLFINSETGEASFGLPEEDNDTENGTNEARIKLVPGGLSKIGNWKIGDRFLYNIVDGTYEKRLDNDIRLNNDVHLNSSNSLSFKQKIMIPHNKHGIILSSDQPYIHVKGKIYEGLNGINYKDEYNDINPGDSLELRLDPNNNSLFSIIQHTTGFNDQESNSLFFGYKLSDEDNIFTIASYEANKNTDAAVQLGDGAEYFIYNLVEEKSGEYKSYYILRDLYKNLNQNFFNEDIIGSFKLEDAILEQNINNTNIFSIDSNTGIITYHPLRLIWKNGSWGASNKKGWSTLTEDNTSQKDNLDIKFKYLYQQTNPINRNYTIGQITNDTGYKLSKINLSYTINWKLSNIILDNTLNNSYIQFYIVKNENDEYDKALLLSEKIGIWYNHNNLNVDLSSENNNKLLVNSSYYLKMKLFINNYNIDIDCIYSIKSKINGYKAPYGIQEIDLSSIDSQKNIQTLNSTTSILRGQYIISKQNNKKQIRFKINANILYDFVLWNKKDLTIFGGGQTKANLNWAKFINTTEQTEDELKDYWVLPDSFNEEVDTLCISFYPKNTCILENIKYVLNTENTTTQTEITIDTNNPNKDYISTVVTNYISNTVLTYQYNSEFSPFNDKIYIIDKNSEIDYSTIGGSWNFGLNNDYSFNISGFIPDDISKLCVKGDVPNVYLQGVPYAKTYWNNNQPKITFYKSYYDWINQPGNNGQYGYINIENDQDNNIYYKYVKTLKEVDINNYFKYENNLIQHSSDTINNVYLWITGTPNNFQNSTYWKEFVRVGLDENGRLFSAGLQDKKTYSRTGRIHAFGKVPNLYGQEIRTETSINTYNPILKIFTNTTSNINTTYITQNQNDNGNISIRTAGNNHYIELTASQFSENENNLIPEIDNFIRISYNNGIQLQAKNDININNINLMNNGLFTNTSLMSILSDYVLNKSPNYLISSKNTSSFEQAVNSSLVENGINHYRIKAIGNNENPIIQLQVGAKLCGIDITTTATSLIADKDNRFIQIHNTSNYSELASFTIDGMKLQFQNKTISLINNGSFITISPLTTTNNTSYKRSIQLKSNMNSSINIADKIFIQGDLIAHNSGTFDQNLHVKSNLYSNNIYVGNNFSDTKAGAIYLYKNNENGRSKYIRLLADDLEQLFYWYNNSRWAMGVRGNTLYIKNVKNSLNPEGSANGSYGYSFALKTFSNYKN